MTIITGLLEHGHWDYFGVDLSRGPAVSDITFAFEDTAFFDHRLHATSTQQRPLPLTANPPSHACRRLQSSDLCRGRPVRAHAVVASLVGTQEQDSLVEDHRIHTFDTTFPDVQNSRGFISSCEFHQIETGIV